MISRLATRSVSALRSPIEWLILAVLFWIDISPTYIFTRTYIKERTVASMFLSRSMSSLCLISFAATNTINATYRSPGYALSLVAESTTSVLHSSEAVSMPGGTPEEVALAASRALLDEVRRGGCVDRMHQRLVLLMMVLGSEDVGRVKMSELSPQTWEYFIVLSLSLSFFSSFFVRLDLELDAISISDILPSTNDCGDWRCSTATGSSFYGMSATFLGRPSKSYPQIHQIQLILSSWCPVTALGTSMRIGLWLNIAIGYVDVASPWHSYRWPQDLHFGSTRAKLSYRPGFWWWSSSNLVKTLNAVKGAGRNSGSWPLYCKHSQKKFKIEYVQSWFTNHDWTYSILNADLPMTWHPTKSLATTLQRIVGWPIWKRERKPLPSSIIQTMAKTCSRRRGGGSCRVEESMVKHFTCWQWLMVFVFYVYSRGAIPVRYEILNGQWIISKIFIINACQASDFYAPSWFILFWLSLTSPKTSITFWMLAESPVCCYLKSAGCKSDRRWMKKTGRSSIWSPPLWAHH